MANLDTARKFHEFADTACQQKQAYIEVSELRDGAIQIALEDARLKSGGKKWHSDFGVIVLTPEQRAALKAAL